MRENLTDIAHDPSAGARSLLLASLGDLVFDGRQPTAEEVSALCAVAKLLLRVADESSRAQFAKTIAPNKHVTREMVFLLLQDKVIVAGPILSHSPVLTEIDLVSFAETVEDERLVHVARRSDLGQSLVELLINRGDEKVHLALTENDATQLSPKSLQILIRNAETSEPLCRSLVRRPEVAKNDAEHLVQLITKMLKSRMKMAAPGAAVTPQPEPASSPQQAKVEPKFELQDVIAALNASHLSPDAAINKLAEDDRFNDLTSVISHLSRMDEVSIMRLLVRADANGIGMILKALDISDATYNSVVALRRRRLKTSESQARFERQDFAKLSTADSKATLAQLNGGRGK